MEAISTKLLDVFRTILALDIKDEEIQQLTRENCPAWDSFGHLSLLLATEEAFKIRIPEDRGVSIVSYWALVQLVEGLVHGS